MNSRPRRFFQSPLPHLASVSRDLNFSLFPSLCLSSLLFFFFFFFSSYTPLPASASHVAGTPGGTWRGSAVAHWHRSAQERLRPAAEAAGGPVRPGDLPADLEQRLLLPGGVRRRRRQVKWVRRHRKKKKTVGRTKVMNRESGLWTASERFPFKPEWI